MSSVHNYNETVLKGSYLTIRSSVLFGWDTGSYYGMLTIGIMVSPRFDS